MDPNAKKREEREEKKKRYEESVRQYLADCQTGREKYPVGQHQKLVKHGMEILTPGEVLAIWSKAKEEAEKKIQASGVCRVG